MRLSPPALWRARFHALVGGKKLHATLASDRFAQGKPFVLDETLTHLAFDVESDNGGEAFQKPGALTKDWPGNGCEQEKIEWPTLKHLAEHVVVSPSR